ncbi:hypothetical protein Tco_0360121 [Tanacetum coccineum]
MLCKIFSKCLTTRVTGWDQPPLQIMQMMYCFINNIHVDYAELLWEGIYYSLHHPISSIPYPRFTKITVSHYMTIFLEISRRARDKYHNLKDDDIMKNIFNSGRHKDRVGMQIPAWMISEEMKHTKHYRMCAEVFGIDVPLTQTPAVRPRHQDDRHDNAHPKGENRAKRQKTSEYEAYMSGESSFGQVFQEEQAPSTLGNQEQDDDFDFYTDSYSSEDDKIPTKQVSQDIMEEVSLTIDEAKLRKMVDEMLRQRCTSGDEHQYHIDQMKNFLKSDIVWEGRKEILVSLHPQKTTPLES